MTERPARVDRTIWLLALFVLGAFFLISDVNHQPKATFADMLDGTAHRPYVTRLLVPQTAQAVSAFLPREARSGLAAWVDGGPVGYALDWIAVGHDRTLELGVVALLLYGSLVGFTYALRRLALDLGLAHVNRLALLALAGLVLFFQHGYIYDFPALALWTLLFLTIAEARWGLFLGCTALAALNKETALLLPGFWLAYGWFLGNERKGMPYWQLFFAQLAIVLPIYALISWLHRTNAGGLVEFNWRVHAASYAAAPTSIALIVAGLAAILLLAWRDAPSLLRGASALFLPLSALYLFFGWPYEFRVFYEVYPILVLLTALAAGRLETWRIGYHEPTLFGGGDTGVARLLLLTVLLLGFALRVLALDRLPPGLSDVEALNGVLAREWTPTLYGWRNGVTAAVYRPLIGVLGPYPFGLRLTSAFVGVLALPLVYVTGQVMVGRARTRVGPWPAVAAAAVLAIIYPHVSLSRLGVPAVLPATLSLLAAYAFWRARRDQRLASYAVGGLALAVACYAGAAGRLLVMAILSFALFEVALRADLREARSSMHGRRHLAGWAMLLLVWLLCMAPLLLEAARDADAIIAGVAQTSIFAAPWELMPGSPRERLGVNLGALARAFAAEGDARMLANLPGRALHDWLLAGLLLFGLIGIVRTLSRGATRFLVLWLVAMTSATLFMVQAPDTLWLAGLLPPLALLSALGTWELTRWLPPVKQPQLVPAAMVAAILLFSGSVTARDYFTRWAGSPELSQEFAVEAQAAAETVRDHTDEPLLLPRSLWLTPQRRFAVDAVVGPMDLPANPVAVTLLNGVVDPIQDRLFLLQPTDNGPVATWVTLRDQATGVEGANSLGLTPIEGASFSPGAPDVPMDVSFANGLTLLGYDLGPDTLEVGDGPVTVTTYWQRTANAPTTDNAEQFVHLMQPGASQQSHAAPGNGYEPALWLPGEIVDDIRTLTPQPAGSAGRATIETGFFQRDLARQLHRLDIIDDTGQPAGDLVQLGAVMIDAPIPTEALTTLDPAGVQFADGPELAGMTVTGEPAVGLTIDLGWQTAARMPNDYNYFVHLLDDDGQIVAQQDGPPGGELPTSLWLPGESLRTTVMLPPAENGQALRIGLYEPVSGRQLPVTPSLPALEGQDAARIDWHDTYIIRTLSK